MQPVDVATIGGGVVGLTVARELAMRGADVMVFEKESPLGEHASAEGPWFHLRAQLMAVAGRIVCA